MCLCAGARTIDRDELDALFSDYIGGEINDVMESAGMHHLNQHELFVMSDEVKEYVYNQRGCAVEAGIIHLVKSILEELDFRIE